MEERQSPACKEKWGRGIRNTDRQRRTHMNTQHCSESPDQNAIQHSVSTNRINSINIKCTHAERAGHIGVDRSLDTPTQTPSLAESRP